MSQKRTCYDTYYPFFILSKHNLTMLDFEPVTILYGGNGSGKTTALNVIAENGLEADLIYHLFIENQEVYVHEVTVGDKGVFFQQ
ncbi:MAG: hypothetical protein K2H31_00475, partial [Lachnospiraceae bacterium]|nr:hypothetical protein [Lachnospiraceae bacterium]